MANNFKNIDDIKELFKSEQKIKIKIKVVAGSKNNSIEFLEDFIKVKIKQRAVEGKANKAIVDFLSDEFKLPKAKIIILNGHKSSIKTVELG